MIKLLLLRLEQHKIELINSEPQHFMTRQGKAQAIEKLLKDLTREEVKEQ